MAIPLWCSRAEIYDEFSTEEQKKYFDLKRNKVLSDYDNFYYSVFVDEDNCKANIDKLVEDLDKLRKCYDFASSDTIDFHGFDYYPFGLKFYNNRLSIKECYDILICNTLPNKKTPRILIQIRARYLWLYGFKKCFDSSYKSLCALMQEYDIKLLSMKENRIDYAFHTNSIQSFEKMFDRKKLEKHCKTNSRIYSQVGDPLQNWSIDYFSIGSRSSKSVFFRAYNKTREVVEKAYKCFFIEIWFQNGLINAYDKYCLEQAYQLKSYDVGLNVGRIKWYLEYGKDENKKEELKKLLKSCYADNDNSSKIKKDLNGVLPAVTVISNLEFETHSDFYRSFNKSMPMFATKINGNDIRYRIFTIYECRKKFVDYLTKYGGSVSFVTDKNIPLKEFEDDMYLHFWKRVRAVKLGTKYKPDIYRSYERNIDINRAKRKVVSDMAVLSIYKNGLNEFDLNEDVSEVFSLLNDNDMCNYCVVNADDGDIVNVQYGDYYTVKQRKNRQYRTLV